MLDISTIVLTYDRLDYTKDCIESYFSTAPHNNELIIVDNGSTDGTRKFLKDKYSSNPKVRLYFSDTNLYPAGGYVKGLSLAKKSKAYLICDNDGFFDNDQWYNTSMQLINGNSKIGIVGLRRSQWESHIFKGLKVYHDADTDYVYSDGIASHTILTESAKNILVQNLQGKWIGHIISNLVKKYGNLESIKLKPGLIYDMSECDLANPKYREMYLKFWKTKGRLHEFKRRIEILEKNK